MGLKDGDSGRFLTGFESAGRDYIVGEAGQRYVIVIQNNSSLRLEVVVSVDGKALVGADDLIATVRDLPPGSRVELGIVRAGEPIDVTAILEARPADPAG